jgi:hypothetical protein
MPTALSTIRTRAQVLYDVAGSQVLSADEWDVLANDAYRKLWRTVTRINKNFRVAVEAFTLVGGTNYQREFAVTSLDTVGSGTLSLQNGAFTTADIGRLVSPRYDAPNTAFNVDYTITNVLSPTFVQVTPDPTGLGSFISPPSGTVVVSAGQIRKLPADYRETRLVRKDPGLETQTILNRYTERVATRSWEPSYRLQDDDLYIEPIGRCAGNYDHLYIPTCPVLASDADTLDAELDQFVEYLVYDMANVALAREETDRLYELDFQRAEKDVIAWASSQRSADPDRVEDVRRRSTWGFGAP